MKKASGEADRSYQRLLIDQANAEMGRQRVSRRQLMRLTGIPDATMNRIFTCERDMNVHQWGLIAEALGFDPGELARKARASAGTEGAPDHAQGPPVGADPRALITWLLENPSRDEELNTRLSESESQTGLTGRRLVTLQETIRTVRREELVNARDALPPSTGDRADRQSG